MSYNHIIKTANDRVLYFFIKEGLCVKDLLSPSDKYKIIYEEAVCDFCVIDTGYGEVGIVCQDDKGSIIFLRESGGTYLKTTLLNNRSQLAYDKYFRLHKHNRWLGLSYIIDYQGEKLLSYQLIDEENQAPLVADSVYDFNYYSFINKSSDIFYFYNREKEFGYKIYKWSKKDFCDYEKLGDGKLLSAVNDNNGLYYIVYEKENSFYLKVINTKDFEFISYDYVIDFLKPNDKINMIVEKNILWITVNRNGFIFGKYCSGEDFVFSSAYNFASEGNLISYDMSINEEDYVFEKCFGYSVNMRPELILYKDLLNTSKTKKEHNIITEDEESNEFFNIEKDKRDELEISLTKLEIRVKELEEKLKNMEENIIKS